jgi:single-stranded-DNA-specific exonuclease
MKREYRWTITPVTDSSTIERLSKEINVSESITRVLVHRGISSYEKAKQFFRPQLNDLHDPFLMSGMERAVERILQALQANERILIFGDYDVDGTNSAAMMYLFLTELGAETIYHIPDRVKEGYGISTLGIDRGKDFGVTLLISIDCGITAVDQVEYARSLGIDVIICDHHEPAETLPKAYAVLDPLIPNCGYPFKSLCGCGVGFKLMQGIAQKRGNTDTVFNYLDFTTLATTADIVPLVGENRILTKIGLELINKSPRPGIQALIESSGTAPGKITTGQIVFVLSPRINAVGRMGDATRAVQLLTSTDHSSAMQLAQVLEEENRNRRKIDEETFMQAKELVETVPSLQTSPAIVLHHKDWHPGVIGIVASRLVEKYYRPAIMMTTVDGMAKGSARSIVGFDIHRALKQVEDKVLQFGGHKYAAGLAVALDRIDEFREAFNAAVEELMPMEIRKPEIRIDAEISLQELTPKFLRVLKEFAPFGPGNMRPIFLSRNVEVIGAPKIVGKDHLRFRVKQDRNIFDAIGFGLGDMIDEVRNNGRALDLVFSVDEHEWPASGTPNGESFPQLKVKDLKQSEGR